MELTFSNEKHVKNWSPQINQRQNYKTGSFAQSAIFKTKESKTFEINTNYIAPSENQNFENGSTKNDN